MAEEEIKKDEETLNTSEEEIKKDEEVKEKPEKIKSKKEKVKKKEKIEKDPIKKETSLEKTEKKQFLIKKSDLWKYATFILLLLVIILGIIAFGGANLFTGQVILGKESANEKLIVFLEDLVPGGNFIIIGSEDLGHLYEVTVSYEGDVFPVYMTKDARYFIPDLIPMNMDLQFTPDPSQQPTPQSVYSEEEVILLTEFNDCLEENGVIIYGSYSCPYCSQLAQLLGGYEAASSVYVECTENYERCTQEMQGQGVPEIQINGKIYTGARTLESLSEATGCPVPNLG